MWVVGMRLLSGLRTAIGATAVITSASHVLGTLAVDLLGSEFGWRIEASSAMVTRASAAVVNGEQVGVYQDAGERGWWDAGKPLPSNVNLCETVEGLGAVTECAADKRPRGCVRQGCGV